MPKPKRLEQTRQKTQQKTNTKTKKYKQKTNHINTNVYTICIIFIYISVYIYFVSLLEPSHYYCVVSSLPFVVCVRSGALCVSLVLHNTNNLHNKQFYNNIISCIKCKTRRTTNINGNIYIYILIYYVYIHYIRIRMYISSMRPTDRLPDCARPPVWTDRTPARPSRPSNQPTKQKQNQQCVMRSIKPLYLWTIPKAPNGKPQQNLYQFFSCISFLPKTKKI